VTSSRFLEAMRRRVLLFDGAMGSTVQAMALDVARDYLGRENCVDVVTRSRPEIIQSIHESFLSAGADAVETNTFGANRIVLAEFDAELASMARALNREAAEVARAAVERHTTSDRPRFVVGSVGPGTRLISLGQTSWDDMHASYQEQAEGLVEGGVDALLIETVQDLLQAKCAVNACRTALEARGRDPQRVPIMVSLTFETTGTMLLGTEIAAAVAALRMFPIACLGLNCATGPVEMTEPLSYLARAWPGAISVIPNAGLPVMVQGRASFPLRAEPFADALVRFVAEHGVNVVGGCCGTTPAHIAALARRLGERAPSSRAPRPQRPGCSSLYQHVEFVQEASFLIVGERTNTNGSRRFRRLLEGGDYEGLVSMARDEIKGGAHVLDVCVDYVGRDGPRDMAEVVSRYVRQVNVPLMIDSTEAPVIEAALKRAGGKCIVNSINLENGERRFDEICPLLRRYGAACVALTIDEDPEEGMAKTASRKLQIAERMQELFTSRWGLDERDLFFDPLTFTVATGNEADRRLALETLEGIRLIRQRFPQCPIILGVSNVSFGLRPAARAVLNSVFLHEALERGLTAAIVHPSGILPRNRIGEEKWEAARWLIFDRRGDMRPPGTDAKFDPLLHFIGLFPEGEAASDAPALETLELEERLRRHIVDGEPQGLEECLDEALQRYTPLQIINDHLLAGMKVVGDLFGSGQMQLPFVLQSAQVMKKAVAHLEPHMERVGGRAGGRARIVLATVAGDVHDIGKNLVDIILTNNGYTIYNLGIKQPIGRMVEALREHDAGAIGMSGLLVKSVGVMEENLKALNALGVRVPVLLGGAALTRHWAESHLRGVYEGPLYYGRDAFEGLRIAEHLAEDRLGDLDAEIDGRLSKRAETEARVAAARRDALACRVGVETALADRAELGEVEAPAAPFLGDRLVEHVDLDAIYPFINTVALFRGQWGFKKGVMSPEEYEHHLVDVVVPIFERLKARCAEERILRPAVVYGWYQCQSQGEDLVIFDPEDPEREIERFTFPRQKARQRLCISDFFKSAESRERDVVGLQCVTMGVEVSHMARQLFERNEYTEYLYLHGLGVEATEALAELWHKRMRAELGIGGEDAPRIRELFTQGYRGSRYSFGYPACPDMSDQEKLFRLLRPQRIGCVLTESWQIDPEQSTSALIVHHPQARYFAV
jgi:5-methyltetrahydrofolate--homocysteine methyltransferase